MCLGIPGRIVEIWGEDFVRMGKVDFGGILREVSLAYVPDAQLEDHVIVHAGFALTVLNEEEAQETWRLLREIGAIADELGVDEQ
jgi:hydrogenase expression/formation protein HypC